ncbi:CinA domain-containing protein [Candidatus Terasakiella magnetica]|uniref:CinA domain-containing protein n=1 Tax=Candidatus Terasakiella magnetica TaxID=1867952 RepID=A0A1C3RCS1_9PROT|nr:CinA family protein [Candidatus Terasakiella magnetica]SCA55070.1 CinA domain-containing protein [Candidatus Terasakiella magnetica]
MSLNSLAKETLVACRRTGLMVSTAESCTGGMISAALTSVAGSSDVVECGFVTYSNTAKQAMLNIPAKKLEKHGAVSKSVAKAMAEGGREASRTDICVAVTGIAGPTGGSDEKPVGLVYIACAKKDGETIVEKHKFEGEREQIRHQTAERALKLIQIQALVP